MKQQQLNEAWQLCVSEAERFGLPMGWLDAQVPGTVYSNLLDQGLIPDPHVRDNELKVLPLMDSDFCFRTMFDAPQEALDSECAELEFEGVDTLAVITLNGVQIGCTDNMHRTWRYDVKEFLRAYNNELCVHIQSPTRYIEEKNAEVEACGITDAMRGFPHLRKAHCMFGWDWGPRLPDAGLFRPVKLLYGSALRIEQVRIMQRHENGHVDVTFCTEISDEGILCYELQTPDGQIIQSDQPTIAIENPQLWWPNGYGAQPLYHAAVILLDEEGRETERWSRRIGLRTIEIDTSEDEYGRRFTQRVNGQDMFAMGADYIPEDNLLTRVSRERTEKLLRAAKEAKHNTIRVWGGGYYPDDFFFDLCDELGLLVWQDFMFACASYELTDSFEATVLAEIRDNVRRIRHHACLLLWCGNNELEMQIGQNRWGASRKQYFDYIKLFEYAIPRLLREESPEVFYWPSSPSSGGNYEKTEDEDQGDSHYWDVWHGGMPFTEYRKHAFRYLSEFGFQSFPSEKTIAAFTDPEDRNIFSYVMEMHQRNSGANGRIMTYLAGYFRYPSDFSRLVYASQLLQGESIRYGVEHFRRLRGQCMGTLVWQLNDIWPGASWAGIDFFGRRKVLHYMEKRAFAPVLISCEEKGDMSEHTSCVEQPHEYEKSFRLNVANETAQPLCGTVEWELRDAGAQVLESHRQNVTVPPFTSQWLEKNVLETIDVFNQYVSYRLLVDGQCASEGTALFTYPKYFCFRDPTLNCCAVDGGILVTASAYARSVEIDSATGDVVLEDNDFDMNAGSRFIRVLSGVPKDLVVRSVYDIDK